MLGFILGVLVVVAVAALIKASAKSNAVRNFDPPGREGRSSLDAATEFNARQRAERARNERREKRRSTRSTSISTNSQNRSNGVAPKFSGPRAQPERSDNDEGFDLATELYLLWIDNGDGDMPVHPKVRDHYTELARMRPACSVDVEAMAWLKMELRRMSDDAIRRMVRTAAQRMGGGPAWDAAHRDNIDDFIRYKNGVL